MHTKGPWHRNIKPASKYPTVWAGRNTHVAYVKSGPELTEEEIEANINLISAAPDLLEALKLARVWMIGCPENSDNDNEHTRVIELVEATIAKAEGKDH